PVENLTEFKDVDIAIEAATENIDLKLELFKKLDEVCKPEAILASNTSSISITLMAAATSRPEKVVGMHFMNPVPIMKLVEMIKGLQTNDDAFEAVTKLAQSWGKTTTVSSDYPGFIVNRLLIPYLNEACSAYMESVGTIEDIDTSIKLGLNHPMGPFQLADLIGLDTVLAIAHVLHNGFNDPKYRPNALLVKYVEAGWLGRKTGQGFYKY
ncbi:MAG: 3-hydroxybutyryl-CoA dehydrogenase, partial [Deltaproteobacteria bacterium]|nr:3-hydroxybutyryl-CoA dehydrogenase [Deltaproteobacteria bacterium]